MRLALFIANNKNSILQDRETFARTIAPPAMAIDTRELRDHASFMSDTIVADLQPPQTDHEQAEKSKGQAAAEVGQTCGEEGRLMPCPPCRRKRKVPSFDMIRRALQTEAAAAVIQEFRHQ